MSVYAGIDVRRRRSQVAVVTGDGTVQLNKNVVNGSGPMLRLTGDLPSGTPVRLRPRWAGAGGRGCWRTTASTRTWCIGCGAKAVASARLKNDKVDAAILAQLLRAGLLPEAGIAPPAVRQLRALRRHRSSLVRLGRQLRNRIHAVAADHGCDREASYWTGPGRGWLAELDLPAISREIVTDCLTVIGGLAPVIERIDGELHQHAKADPRVKVASRQSRADAGWVLARPLRQPTRRDNHDPPSTASTKGILPRFPMMRRRSPASSSFVLTAARLSGAPA